MPFFHFDCKTHAIVVNNAAHSGEEFSVCAENENLIVTVLPQSDNSDSYQPPLFGLIGIHNGAPVPYGGLKLIKWNENNFDVIYTLPKIPYYQPPTALAQESYMMRGDRHTVTLYQDNALRLMCECSETTANFDIDCPLSDARILMQPTSLGFLIIVTAKSEKREYLNLLIYDGEYRKLYEITADEIQFSESSFTVTQNIPDMLARTIAHTHTFANGAFAEKARVFSYRHEKDYHPSLTPYLFLEALKAGDDARAKSYLNDELSSMYPHFKEYFGDFKSIECPRHSEISSTDGLSTVAILDECGKSLNIPRVFSFTLFDSKIQNVTQLPS